MNESDGKNGKLGLGVGWGEIKLVDLLGDGDIQNVGHKIVPWFLLLRFPTN